MIGFKNTWDELTWLLVAHSDRADDGTPFNFQEELITNKFDNDLPNTILVWVIIF